MNSIEYLVLAFVLMTGTANAKYEGVTLPFLEDLLSVVRCGQNVELSQFYFAKKVRGLTYDEVETSGNIKQMLNRFSGGFPVEEGRFPEEVQLKDILIFKKDLAYKIKNNNLNLENVKPEEGCEIVNLSMFVSENETLVLSRPAFERLKPYEQEFILYTLSLAKTTDISISDSLFHLTKIISDQSSDLNYYYAEELSRIFNHAIRIKNNFLDGEIIHRLPPDRTVWQGYFFRGKVYVKKFGINQFFQTCGQGSEWAEITNEETYRNEENFGEIKNVEIFYQTPLVTINSACGRLKVDVSSFSLGAWEMLNINHSGNHFQAKKFVEEFNPYNSTHNESHLYFDVLGSIQTQNTKFEFIKSNINFLKEKFVKSSDGTGFFRSGNILIDGFGESYQGDFFHGKDTGLTIAGYPRLPLRKLWVEMEDEFKWNIDFVFPNKFQLIVGIGPVFSLTTDVPIKMSSQNLSWEVKVYDAFKGEYLIEGVASQIKSVRPTSNYKNKVCFSKELVPSKYNPCVSMKVIRYFPHDGKVLLDLHRSSNAFAFKVIDEDNCHGRSCNPFYLKIPLDSLFVMDAHNQIISWEQQ